MLKRTTKIIVVLTVSACGLIAIGCTTAETERNAPQNKIVAENKSVVVANENKQAANANAQTANAATTAAPYPAQRQSAIDSYIAGVAKASDGEEYKEARKIVYGDLDADGDEDAVAQFTVEGMGGGNNYVFMLAAFRNDNGKFSGVTDETVGGKLGSDVELTKIENGKIHLNTKEMGANDTPINKNVGGNAVYVLKNNKLIEEKSNNRK